MSRRLAGWLLLAAVAAAPKVPSGEEAMRRVNQRPRGGDAEMQVRLVLTDLHRGTLAKQVQVRRRGTDGRYRTVYRVASPPSELGIVLEVAEDKALNGMWMYFPHSSHLLRVASRGLSALGTDFSCEDLKLTVPLAEYRIRSLGRAELDGRPYLQVEMVPAEPALRQELDFSRTVGWIREDIWLVARADFYDEQNTLFKTYRVDEVKQIQGIWTVTRSSMNNLRADHRTNVEVSDVRYGVDLSHLALAPDNLHRLSGGLEAKP
jgi:hypothetical protein